MERQQIFILLWTIANVFSLTTLWLLIAALIRSRKARAQKFNVYLILSVLPDAIRNTLFCALNVINFVQFRPWACTAIGWGEAYYTAANYWMGAVVLHEIYKLLVDTKQCARSRSSRAVRSSSGVATNNDKSRVWRKLFVQAAAVNAFALLMASIMLETSVDWIPDISIETQCEAFPRNARESYYFWIVHVFLCMIIPTVYVFYLSYVIYRNSLLPLTGRTRALALYFFRLIAIFVTFWIVFVIAVSVKGWAQAICFVVFNLCGFFSFCFAITKPDVKEAVLDMIFCKEQRMTVDERYATRTRVSNVSEQVRMTRVSLGAGSVAASNHATAADVEEGRREESFENENCATRSRVSQVSDVRMTRVSLATGSVAASNHATADVEEGRREPPLPELPRDLSPENVVSVVASRSFPPLTATGMRPSETRPSFDPTMKTESFENEVFSQDT